MVCTCFVCRCIKEIPINFPEVLCIVATSEAGDEFDNRIPQKIKINVKHAAQVKYSGFKVELWQRAEVSRRVAEILKTQQPVSVSI